MADVGKKLSLLFESRVPVVVLVGAVLVGIVSNGLYEILRGRLGGPLITVTAGVVLIVLVIWLVEPMAKVRDWIRARLRTSMEIRADVRRRRALIALVSHQRAGERQAVDEAAAYHRADESGRAILRHCWLIAGPGVGDPARKMLSSQQKAELLRQELEAAGIQTRILRIDNEPAGDDPMTSMALVDQAFSEAAAIGLEPEDVIADYTGGTKTMTAGMILACGRGDRKLEFMKPRHYRPDGTAAREEGSEPREVNIAFTLLPVEERGSGSSVVRS